MRLRTFILVSVLITPLLRAYALRAQSPSPELASLAVSSIQDLEASVTVIHADLPALERINKDFGIAYRLREVTIRYKEPDKFRMESRIGVMIVNGPTRFIHVPQLGLRKRDEVGESLSRRHSLLDLGIVTTEGIARLDARHLRAEELRGIHTLVFAATPKPPAASRGSAPGVEKDRFLLWIDPHRKNVMRKRWMGNDGRVRATFDYLDPIEIAPGVWTPTKIEVRNGEGVLAGATKYRDVKINQSLPDTLFAIEGASKPRSSDDGR